MGWRAAATRALGLLGLLSTPRTVAAQGAPDTSAVAPARGAPAAHWVAGAAVALVSHESGHVLANLAFDVPMTLERVEFAGMPFFSVTHGSQVTPRQNYVISSAGLWVQHASSEWILTRHPNIRRDHRPFEKGVMTFNTALSMGYAASAFAQSGPAQRDPRSIAVGLGVREPTIGAMILAPALLDAWRYYAPGHRPLTWASRGLKLGLVLLTVR